MHFRFYDKSAGFMNAQAFRQPQALAAERGAKFQGGGRGAAVFIGVVSGRGFARSRFRAGGARPWLTGFGYFRLFQTGFLCPARHLIGAVRIFAVIRMEQFV